MYTTRQLGYIVYKALSIYGKDIIYIGTHKDIILLLHYQQPLLFMQRLKDKVPMQNGVIELLRVSMYCIDLDL